MDPTQLNPSNTTDQEAFAAFLSPIALAVEEVLESLLKGQSHLQETLRYSVLGGGKRFRAFLTVSVADLFQVPRAQSLRAAAAIELIHAYSLIHDDLPAMDNADLRRGKPSCHIQFDDASAILAGDTLIPLAFEVLVDPATHPDAKIQAQLVRSLSHAIGPQGMPLGQMMDLGLEAPITTAEDLMNLEILKTGELIACSCDLGTILGQADALQQQAIRTYALKMGLAFQIVDDLLDATSTEDILGKPTRQDQSKPTFISFLGQQEAKSLAQTTVNEAIEALDPLPFTPTLLEKAAYFALSRLK